MSRIIYLFTAPSLPLLGVLSYLSLVWLGSYLLRWPSCPLLGIMLPSRLSAPLCGSCLYLPLSEVCGGNIIIDCSKAQLNPVWPLQEFQNISMSDILSIWKECADLTWAHTVLSCRSQFAFLWAVSFLFLFLIVVCFRLCFCMSGAFYQLLIYKQFQKKLRS